MTTRRTFIKALGLTALTALAPTRLSNEPVKNSNNWEKIKSDLNIQKVYQLNYDDKEMLIIGLDANRCDLWDIREGIRDAFEALDIDLDKHPIMLTTYDLSIMSRSELLDMLKESMQDRYKEA